MSIKRIQKALPVSATAFVSSNGQRDASVMAT